MKQKKDNYAAPICRLARSHGRRRGLARRRHRRWLRVKRPRPDDCKSGNARVLNSSEDLIANVDEGTTGYPIRLIAFDDGSFRIVNGRTGFARTYPAQPGHRH